MLSLTSDVLFGMLSAAPDALVVVDAEETIVFVNAGAEALFGWSASELLGQGISCLVPERFADQHDHHCARYRANPTRRPMGAGSRLSARRRDGSEFPAEISLSSFEAPTGLLVLVAVRDMTLAARWDLFERFANTTEIGLAVLESNMVVYSNPSLAALVGANPESPFTVDDFIAMVHPADRAKVEASVNASGRGESNTVELRVINRTGELRWLRVTNEAFGSGDSPVLRVGTTVTDITELKSAEHEARAARDEAERANAAKDEFLSRVSHELRTPLNAVLGFGQLLALDQLRDDQRESVGHIVAAGTHLLGLIDEVLDISRVSSGSMRLSMEPVRVGDVIAESIGMVRPLADRRNVRIMSGDEGGELYVTADRRRLKQVVLNLLANAVKYNSDGGAVFIETTITDRGRMRLTITDTGIGIAGDDIGRLFQSFERLAADESGVEGSGLGLALTRGLMTAMNGEVGLTSEIGEGSSFWIELPTTTLLSPEIEEARSPAATGTARVGAGGYKTVLYVEDNASNVRLLERLVATTPRIRLVVALQGRLAIEMAVEHRPDLILLDLHLPDISGEHVLRDIRADARTAATPVVMLSADASPQIRQRLIEQGATAFLTKPFDIQRLLAIVDNPDSAREQSTGTMQRGIDTVPPVLPTAPSASSAVTQPGEIAELVHELNNDLGIILNYAAMLARSVTDPIASSDLTNICIATEHAADLVRRLR